MGYQESFGMRYSFSWSTIMENTETSHASQYHTNILETLSLD